MARIRRSKTNNTFYKDIPERRYKIQNIEKIEKVEEEIIQWQT